MALTIEKHGAGAQSESSAVSDFYYIGPETGECRTDPAHDCFGAPLPVNPFFPSFVSSIASLVEPRPVEFAPDNELDEKWDEALAKFKDAAEIGDLAAQQNLFDDLINMGVQRYRLEGSFEALQESRQILKKLEERKEFNDYVTEHVFRTTLACHAVPDEIQWQHAQAAAFAEERELPELIATQAATVAEKERIRETAIGALERDLLAALDGLEGAGIDPSMPSEMTLSPAAASLLGDTFRSLGDFDRAQKYYVLAGDNPAQNLTGSVWYELQALEMDVLSGDGERIRSAVAEIEELRPRLTELLFMTYEDAMNAQDGSALGVEGGYSRMNAGDPSQVYEIEALSWGILYDAYVQLGDGEKLSTLEDERRQTVKGRIGSASPLEAELHVRNMERVALFETVHNGGIEAALRGDDAQAAREVFDQLLMDVTDIHELIKPHMTVQRGDSLFERFAQLNFRTFFDGYLAQDLPQTALRNLHDYVIEGFGDTNFMMNQLADLRARSPQLFTDGGEVNPEVDLSGTEQGKEAADQLMTAYWRSNDIIRELGVPMGAAGACFAIGAAFSETLVVPAVAAAVCGAGGSLANREINKAAAAEQYRQAAMTGITRLTQREASGNRRVWYFSEGLNAAFNAMTIGPMMTIWGRAGYQAVRTGAVRAGTWVAAETGGQAVVRSLATPAKMAIDGAANVVQGAQSFGKWYWKLPAASRIHLAGAIPATADYAFIDREGDLVPWDGELNHWYGYAGVAALASEGGFQLFRRTWEPWFANPVMQSSVRPALIRAGADMIAADYYLVNDDEVNGYSLVDFNASRETAREANNFKKQLGCDTYLSLGGLAALGGDWMMNEWTVMPMVERVVLLGSGASLTYDMVEDGELDPWAGGVGGSLVIAVLGHRLVNVSSAGSMAFFPLKYGYEWIIQMMQDVPWHAPNPRRMMSNAGESVFMMVMTKGTYMGNHYWNTFRLGKSLARWAERAPLLKNMRSVQDMSRVSLFGGYKPSIEGWSSGSQLEPVMTKTVNGAREYRFKLRGDKNRGELSNGTKDIYLVARFEDGQGEPVFYKLDSLKDKLPKGKRINGEFLRNNGLVWHNGSLYSFAPTREGSVYRGGQRMTVEDVKSLEGGQYSQVIRELEESGWTINEQTGMFERNWIKRPYSPDDVIFDSQISGGKPTTVSEFKSMYPQYADYKVVRTSVPTAPNSSFKKFFGFKNAKGSDPAWLVFERETVSTDNLLLGGHKYVTWTGPRERPKYSWYGVGLQYPLIMGNVFLANELIFRKTAQGDRSYQTAQRLVNYGITIPVTWKYIQAPLGMDTFGARIWGGLVGPVPISLGNLMFPTYRNTVPGQETLYGHLDAGGSIPGADNWNPISNNAFDSLRKTTTSLHFLLPLAPAYGSFWEIEPNAVDNIHEGWDCRLDIAQGLDVEESDSCAELPVATQDQIEKLDGDVTMEMMEKRLDTWAKVFREKMEEEREGDLSMIDRRLLITLAAWFKQMLVNFEQYEPLLPGEPQDGERRTTLDSVRELKSDYSWFFDDIPTLNTDSQWEDFIAQVNSGRSQACDFYFDPHIQSHLQ